MHPESVTVVVPTYNERENIAALAESVLSQGFRLLVVDDGSPDGTGAAVDELAQDRPLLDVLHRTAKQGLGPAYAAGFERALASGAQIVCEMDADFSHDPADLPRLVKAVSKGADLAIGSRYVAGGSTPDWTWPRKLISRGGNWYARLMLGMAVGDATAGFRAFRRSCLEQLEAGSCRASGYGFQVEMTLRATDRGCRIEEIPITFRDRTAGTSKMGGGIVLEAMWLVTRWGLQRRFGRLRSPR